VSGPEGDEAGACDGRTLSGASRRQPDGAATPRHHNLDNLLLALDRIEERLRRVIESDRADFHDGTASYDAASLAIIRLHALREGAEYAAVFGVLGADEAKGLSHMRNIASHTGYQSMDDDLLWDAATRLLPELLPRLREAAVQQLGSQHRGRATGHAGHG
jgi:hypothetical protein